MQALGSAADAPAEERDEMQGWIRITSTTAFGRSEQIPRIEVCMRENPRVRVDLVLSDQWVALIASRGSQAKWLTAPINTCKMQALIPRDIPMSKAPVRSRRSTRRRSGCPIACTLDLIGDRWTLLVLRDLFAGKTRFVQFARSPERIASNILANRLNALVAHGFVERRLDEQSGFDSYHLLKKARSLGPVLLAMRDWGLANLPNTKAMIELRP